MMILENVTMARQVWQLKLPPPATAWAEGTQLNGRPFPATASAEGAQFNGPPSPRERGTRGHGQEGHL